MRTLCIKDISYTYNKVDLVIENLSLSLDRKDFIIIEGANGSGKSTLLKIIMGLLPVPKGEIIFDMQNVTNYSASRRSKLGFYYLAQQDFFFPNLSVHENLCLCTNRSNSKIQLEIIYNLLPELFDLKNKIANVLSGGQRKLLAFGMIYLKNPKLLLLDEPFTGLSENSREKAKDILKTLIGNGISIICADHRSIFLEELFTKKMYLKKGCLN